MHISTRFMHKNALMPLRVQAAGMVEIDHDVPLHRHPIVELVYYLQGDVHCRLGESVVACHPGTLCVVPPQVIHGEIGVRSFTCIYIWLEAPLPLLWPTVYVDDRSNALAHVCHGLVREWNGQERDREEMLDTLINQCDILLRRAHNRDHVPTSEQLVRDGEHLIKERFMTSVTIKEIAETLRVSPSLLRTQFVRLRGCTPMEYLQAVRVEHALSLIRNSDLCLDAVAQLCGYDSSSHLSRHVKRVTGKRPGNFRLKNQGAA
jgi:AraC-like DNA-binding protein